MTSKTKWLITLLLVYVVMSVYWFEALVEIVLEGRRADFFLFFLMGLISASAGFSATAGGSHLVGVAIEPKTFCSISFAVSLLVLYAVTSWLTRIVTAT